MRLMRSTTAAALAAVMLLGVAGAVAQPTATAKDSKDPELVLIKAAALDYIEGWYEANPERMARAVHPELVKRLVVTEGGKSRIEQMGATKLVANVRAGGGKKTTKPRKEVQILDRFENVASVRIVATDWIDYLHLAKIDGRWQIVNVLWEVFPKR